METYLSEIGKTVLKFRTTESLKFIPMWKYMKKVSYMFSKSSKETNNKVPFTGFVKHNGRLFS